MRNLKNIRASARIRRRAANRRYYLYLWTLARQ